ncbi:ABC transporter permease [Arcticibacter tournemirensis]|uniref:ABC transporter permease n=1 Tax=Arcticibacter tournemirensis TaxID=699437 RepID=A0A4V1KI79_9SPHI|nr:ABC transporter permease [Arcticibacter tournemirensis]RXF69752.1 ABC transporter permease [Arcticibacter tournemirensis]
MIKSYILIAMRNMWKRKVFTLIQMLGLSISFGAALILFLTAMFEFSFDDFHKNKDKIYQAYRQQYSPHGIENDSPMPVPFAPAAQQELSGIKYISRFGNAGGLLRYNDKFFDISLKYADPSFLQMFSFPLLSGNAAGALQKTDEVIITRSYAETVMGTKDATGKTIEIKTDNGWKSYIISGVAEDPPKNSSLKFDILSRFENFPGYKGNEDKWSNHNHPVFLQLADNIAPDSFEQSARPFINKYFQTNIKNLKRDGAKPDTRGQFVNLKLLPLSEIHFSSISSVGQAIKPFFPFVLILLSAVILFIGGSNFVNLSLAASFTRAREIGVRKTFGAQKKQIIIQFWCEAFILCFLALLAGTGLLFAGLKSYLAATGSNMSADILFTGQAILWFCLVFLLTTALAGGYPSLVMARFNTLRTLQGKLNVGSKNGLRNTLTIVQFCIAIILIISTLTISKQLSFIRNMPLGFNKAEVISIPIGNDIDPESALQQMRNKIASIPSAVSVTGTDINLGRGLDGSVTNSVMGFDYKNREIKTNWLRIDYDYLKTLDIPLIKGRDFSRAFGTDTASVLINEKMAALLGEKEPVGTMLPLGDGHNVKVIGVVKDFHFKNLHQEIKPLTMVIQPGEWPVSYIFVRVKGDNLVKSMQLIEKAWKEVNPRSQTGASFLDENTDREYKKEEGMSKIFSAGAGLAIFISCMGLFASALLAMNQRVKEIGIRKVLGASVANIIVMLSKDFARLVMIAFVIAAPLTWFIMHKWLEDFVYHINVSGWIILAGGLIVFSVALLTVSFHSVKAALANPVKSLRSE